MNEGSAKAETGIRGAASHTNLPRLPPYFPIFFLICSDAFISSRTQSISLQKCLPMSQTALSNISPTEAASLGLLAVFLPL